MEFKGIIYGTSTSFEKLLNTFNQNCLIKKLLSLETEEVHDISIDPPIIPSSLGCIIFSIFRIMIHDQDLLCALKIISNHEYPAIKQMFSQK